MKVGHKWKELWISLEQEGNIGLDYCINPVLFPLINKFLSTNDKNTVVDFGAGTNILALQFLYGYKDYIPALKLCPSLYNSRENIAKFIGLETTGELVDEFNKYKKGMGIGKKVSMQQFDIIKNNQHPFKSNSVDLCVSRNFLMHLSIDDLNYHIKEVSRILKDSGKYIFAILNPDYELNKFSLLNNGKILQEGVRYDFSHGKSGEYGVFYHYYKSIETYEKTITNYFKQISITKCLPISDQFKKSHKRYYDEKIPMALIFEIQK